MGELIQWKKRILENQPHIALATNEPIAHFNTIMPIQLKEAKINFIPIQSGIGDASPENVKTITGWTSITIDHSGKNMLKCDGYPGNGTAGGITYTSHKNTSNNIDYVTCSGKTTQNNCFRNLTSWIIGSSTRQAVPRGNISLNSFSDQANLLIVRPDGLPNGYGYPISDDGGGIRPSRTGWFNWNTDLFDEYNMWARIQIYPYATDVEVNTIVYPMICHSTDRGCNYEAYYGETNTISWENNLGVVYGGYVDLINGKLIKEWNKIKIKDCQVGLTSNSSTAWHNWFINLPSSAKMTQNFSETELPIICDTFLATPQTGGFLSQSQTKPIMWASSVEGNLRVKYATDRTLTAAEFKTKYGEVEVTYKLATPIEYDITPLRMQAFKGTNNIWSSANGTVDIKYWTH